ncbi:hypothetical protein MTO96_018048 [Rhipicephalus appendiculatus]
MDDLTDLERELLRRSDALHVVPYKDTPLQTGSASLSPAQREQDCDDPDEPPLPDDPERVGWCRCGRCRPMPTASERLCCRDIRQCTERNVECICEDEYFYTICLDTEVLRVTYCELRERGDEPVVDVHE